MLIEPSIYLSALLRDFYIAGGRVVVKEFRTGKSWRDCVSRYIQLYGTRFTCTLRR